MYGIINLVRPDWSDQIIIGEGIVEEKVKPESAVNLKETFVQHFEELIISGYFSIGEKLPSERGLSKLLGVSRQIVREGLTELSSMGLVSMKARVGTVVNDFRKNGSLSLLNALFRYREGVLGRDFFNSVVEMRMLMEVDFARLAALNHREEHIILFEKILEEEHSVNPDNVNELVNLDYRFHQLIAIATDNLIYPLYANSFKPFHANLVERFYSDTAVAPEVFKFHEMLVRAIKNRDEKSAQNIMKQMLDHGEEHVNDLSIRKTEGRK
jgi:DNA-binding FadR family transcriptional regulator